MAEPVPNNLSSLQDALERKLVELDPLLAQLHENHSFETYARKAGYTEPKLNEEGKPIYESIDEKKIPKNVLETLKQQSMPHAAYRHFFEDFQEGLIKTLEAPDLTPVQKIESVIEELNLNINDLTNAMIPYYPQIDGQPFLKVLGDCKNLCEDFLRRQEQQAKSAGGSRGA